MRVALALAWLASCTLSAQDVPQFRSGVELVRIETTVLDNRTRKPVRGLTCFAVFEELFDGVAGRRSLRLDHSDFTGRRPAVDRVSGGVPGRLVESFPDLVPAERAVDVDWALAPAVLR